MLDKIIDRFLVYVCLPFALIYGITMSFLKQDNLALIISIVGTIVIVFLIVKGEMKNAKYSSNMRK